MTQFAEDTKVMWKVINTLAGKMLFRQIGCTWQKLTVSTLITSAKANAPVMMEENCSEMGFSSAAKELGVKPKRMN